jgi:mannitol/fructose-specific phosphotransferase system IIA component (Ntr-type)
MDLHRYISKYDIISDMKARDRWAALEELLGRVLPKGSRPFDSVLHALCQADMIKCSAVGRSVTVAHAVAEEVAGLRVVFGRSKAGIPWDAPDGRTVNLLWLLVHPAREHDRYLSMLSQIVRLCREDGNRKSLLEAASARDIREVIRRQQDAPSSEAQSPPPEDVVCR